MNAPGIRGDGLYFTEEEEKERFYKIYKTICGESLMEHEERRQEHYQIYEIGELTTIETAVDRLLDFIHIRGYVGIKETAKALSLEASQVEKFAELLEKNGLIEIKHNMRGLFLQMPKRNNL